MEERKSVEVIQMKDQVFNIQSTNLHWVPTIKALFWIDKNTKELKSYFYFCEACRIIVEYVAIAIKALSVKQGLLSGLENA